MGHACQVRRGQATAHEPCMHGRVGWIVCVWRALVASVHVRQVVVMTPWQLGSVISMPDPPIRSTLSPDPTPIHIKYLHWTSPRTYTVLHIRPPLSLPPSVPMLYLLLVSSLSIAYLRPFIITTLSHMSPFVTIPPPYALSILRPLPTCSSYLPTCSSILTSDPRSERHSI